MPYIHDTYRVPEGRNLVLSQETLQRGITIPRQLAMIAFRLPPHDELTLGNGFVVPSTADTQRINDERVDRDATPLYPVESIQKDTIEEFIASTVAAGFMIAQEGFPFATGQINPDASEQEIQLIQQIGQNLQQGECQGTADPELHLGLYL